MNAPKLAALAALAILAVAACGGSTTSTGSPTGAATQTAATTPPAPTGGTTTTPAPTAGTLDMCSLYSAADLKTVTGDDYAAGVLDSVGRCSWAVTSGAAADGRVVAFISKVSLDAFKGNNPGGTDVTVSGHAGYKTSASGLESIWVDVDGQTLVVSWDPVDAGGPAIALQLAQLAEIALSNM